MRMNRCRSVVATLCVIALVPLDLGKPACGAEPSPAAMGAWVKEQVDDGRLTLEFYDPAKPPRPFPGWTEFEFRQDYKYEYQVDFPKPKRGVRKAIIFVTYTKIDFVAKHKIQLPRTLESKQWYAAGLGHHELDHVRVGMHPRLTMLGKHLVKKVERLEFTIQSTSEVTGKWVNAKLDAEITPRRDAIYDLVHAINKKIDTLSDHGANPLPNRDEFLEGLYLKESLDELKFPYLTEVLDLVDSREYQRAKLPFREPEPQK